MEAVPDAVAAPAPSAAEVRGLLREVHGVPAADLEALAGGHWSSAFGYRVGDRALVLRLSTISEGFAMDRAAMAFDRPHLPVPEVLEVGEALGLVYAISVRHHGRFLESVRPDEAAAAGAALQRTLDAMREVPAGPDATVDWCTPLPGPGGTWEDWLGDGLVDDPRRHVHGWRQVLAAEPHLDGLFRACERRIGELLGACPERRDLVHGDLLNRNVLLSDDASEVTAVFSWKCSVRGDFLYDVAWCTFWGGWHPGIAAIDVWERTVRSEALPAEALRDAAIRHHCYQLHIGATHLGWHAWTGDLGELRAVAARTEHLLEQGPPG